MNLALLLLIILSACSEMHRPTGPVGPKGDPGMASVHSQEGALSWLSVKDYGAIGDGVADDSVAIQAAVDFAHTHGDRPVYMPAGRYMINNTIRMNKGEFTAPSLLGDGGYSTRIVAGSMLVDHASLLEFFGGSGSIAQIVVEGIVFEGSGSTKEQIGVNIRGQDGVRILRCIFQKLAFGVRFSNTDGANFTEFCVVDTCEFADDVGVHLHYFRNSADLSAASFHGSGCVNSTGHANGTTPVIKIEDTTPQANSNTFGALLYNTPFGITLFGSKDSVLISSNSGKPILAFGQINLEGELMTLARGGAVIFNGTVNTLGQVRLGSFEAHNVITRHGPMSGPLNGSTTTWHPHSKQVYTLATGKTTLSASNVSTDIFALITLHITASNYDYRYMLSASHNGYGQSGYVNILSKILEFNAAGYGPPSLSLDTQGALIVDNPNFPDGIVTATVYKLPLAAVGYRADNQ